MREKACLWKCQGWSARRREVRGRQAGKRPAGPQASPQAPPPPRGPALRPVQRAQGSGPHSAGLLGPHLPAAPLPAPFKLGRGPKGRRLGPPFRTGVAAKQPGAWPAPGPRRSPRSRWQGSCGSALPSALPAASPSPRAAGRSGPFRTKPTSGCRQKEEPQDPSLLRLCPPPLPPKEAAASADRDTLAAINFYLVKAQSVPVVSIDSVSGKQITGLRVGAWVGVRGLRGRGHPPHLLPLPWKLWSPIGQNTWGGLGLN